MGWGWDGDRRGEDRLNLPFLDDLGCSSSDGQRDRAGRGRSWSWERGWSAGAVSGRYGRGKMNTVLTLPYLTLPTYSLPYSLPIYLLRSREPPRLSRCRHSSGVGSASSGGSEPRAVTPPPPFFSPPFFLPR